MAGISAPNWIIKTMRSFDETPIRYGRYCRSDQPENIVLFLNGRTEWIEKYLHLPQFLAIPVTTLFLTMDYRGQGASGGIRADIRTYQTYVDDVRAVLAKINLADLEISIVAHSMGGLIALYGCLSEQLKPSRILLSAPLLGFPQRLLNVPAFAMAIGWMQYTKWGSSPHNFASQEVMPAFLDNPYTHDRQRYEQIKKAPYQVPPATFNWIHATLQAMKFVDQEDQIKKLTCPLMIMIGTEERVMDDQACFRWIEKASKLIKSDLVLQKVEQARHELFFESSDISETVAKAVREWLWTSQ